MAPANPEPSPFSPLFFPVFPADMTSAGQGWPLWALATLCLLVCLGAGGCVPRKSGPGTMPPVSETSVVSRVIMPPRGGQTIVVPRFMADVQKLWSPLGRTESTGRTGRGSSLPPPQHELLWQDALGQLGPREQDAARRYLDRLAGSYRGTTTQALRRAEKHMPVLLEGLRRQGLPQELACLPLVESTFETRAVSRAGAAGLWQLMPETARRYGLTVNSREDERFDVVRATHAATAYLRFLYTHFEDWPLAVAAYNCGEGTMRRALTRTGSRSLEELLEKNSRLPREERVLQDETVQYVPKFAAALSAMTQGKALGLATGDVLSQRATAAGEASPVRHANSQDARLSRRPSAEPPMPSLVGTQREHTTTGQRPAFVPVPLPRIVRAP